MINFVSTFPPIMCGIGNYTKYLASKMPEGSWGVTSLRLDGFLKAEESFELDKRISYTISLSNPHLPSFLDGAVLWFEHAFGMWGRESPSFLKLIEEAKERQKKTIASFHTIHFQSDETPQGIQEKEKRLLEKVLPLIDVLTVFTKGAYQTVAETFPEYKDKVVVLRHGVYLYPEVNQKEARKKLLSYLIKRTGISQTQKEELKSLYRLFSSDKLILLGNFGFITRDKDPLKLYQLREILQDKLPSYQVIAIYIGMIQQRKDKKMEESLPILERLKSIHDGRKKLFFENYIPESIFPFAFQALDFAVFWCHNATQSGRIAHAQGAGACVVGRNIEGIGETLKLSGLPAADTLEGLAERIKILALKPELKKKAQRSSWRYAQQFSYEVQAQKHLLLEEAVRSGGKLPILDRI
ncbi:MAG: hypothetical protein D4S01_01805 [Dehalococcoidia bacterium]|nr:MAG: hypothetical protein D4S01_01805 [Dehalococcoidia bacterium]